MLNYTIFVLMIAGIYAVLAQSLMLSWGMGGIVNLGRAGCYINIGNGPGEAGCEVHNPGYDFNDDALPLGAAFFARLVETRLKA